MPKCIVITTIAAPTEAVHRWSEVNGYRVIVVGDRKTPIPWAAENCEFISAFDQESLGTFADALPWNHYSRKMLGYVRAAQLGATTIIDTDDDNWPLVTWRELDFRASHEVVSASEPFLNVYSLFCDGDAWPRGFPLHRILATQKFRLEKKEIQVGIWQGLVSDEPDMDAIYRLTRAYRPVFSDRAPVVLQKGCICPFNSQNTAFIQELFPLLYLPTTVTFRFTDILRSIVAQPIMWAAGYHLGFTAPTALQRRNPHDPMKDFESEIPMYLKVEEAFHAVNEAVKPKETIVANLLAAYLKLVGLGIVRGEEMPILMAWLNALKEGKSVK